jgi:hypothetical protein
MDFRKELYNQYSLHHSRDIAGSGLRPLSKIPHCCRSKASGPCLSPSVADHSLKSAKDLWLGRLLPYQLPNPPQAHLTTELYLSYSPSTWRRIFEIYSNCEADSYVLLTRSPRQILNLSFDLHVLSLSLAFILSQDQTQNN